MTVPPERGVHTRDEHWMALAIEAAQRVPALPFGAVLVDETADALRASGWNRGGNDPTGHGEIDVIQRFAAESPDVDWTVLTLYTTAEPCPLCAAAVAWAGIPRVVYGVSIPWLVAHGWWQIGMRADELFARAPDRPVTLRGGVLESACAALFVAARET